MVRPIDEHDGFDSIAVGHTITVDKLLPVVDFPDRREVPARSRGWPRCAW